jgi:hypothetical protein
MTSELITFETAKLAKEKGFIEACDAAFQPKGDGYTTSYGPPVFSNANIHPKMYARPTQDLLERWFREKHALMPGQIPIVRNGVVTSYMAVVVKINKIVWNEKLDQTEYTSFELAREAALLHALKLLP